MWAVAGDATTTQNYAMGVKAYALFTGIFLITMAANAEVSASFGPELELVCISMGVMADGAVAGSNRTMDMSLGLEFYFVDVTLKAYLINPTREHGDFGVACPFSVAAQAIDVCGWPVQPFIFAVEFSVTGKTYR